MTPPELAAQLRDALHAELERSKGAREALVMLDSETLMEGAQKREAFNAKANWLAEELKGSLDGPRANDLAELLTEIRGLSGALKELDGLNQYLAERALSCVRAWGAQLSPKAQAYDRTGVPYQSTQATHSEHA